MPFSIAQDPAPAANTAIIGLNITYTEAPHRLVYSGTAATEFGFDQLGEDCTIPYPRWFANTATRTTAPHEVTSRQAVYVGGWLPGSFAVYFATADHVAPFNVGNAVIISGPNAGPYAGVHIVAGKSVPWSSPHYLVFTDMSYSVYAGPVTVSLFASQFALENDSLRYPNGRAPVPVMVNTAAAPNFTTTTPYCHMVGSKFGEQWTALGFVADDVNGIRNLPAAGFPTSITYNSGTKAIDVEWDYRHHVNMTDPGFLYTQDTAFELGSVASTFSGQCAFPPTHVVLGGGSNTNPTRSGLIAGIPDYSSLTTGWYDNKYIVKDTTPLKTAVPVHDADGVLKGWANTTPEINGSTYMTPLNPTLPEGPFNALVSKPFPGLYDSDACLNRGASFFSLDGHLDLAHTPGPVDDYTLPLGPIYDTGFTLTGYNVLAASTFIPTSAASVDVKVCFGLLTFFTDPDLYNPLQPPPSTLDWVLERVSGSTVTLIDSGTVNFSQVDSAVAQYDYNPPYAPTHIVYSYFAAHTATIGVSTVGPFPLNYLRLRIVAPADAPMVVSSATTGLAVLTPLKVYPFTPGFMTTGPGAPLPGLMRRLF